ncbi:NAD-dependent epimerase/dehydratase family protein [Streptomyces sp. NPDC020096]
MKILVTGATGYAGPRIAAALRREGHAVLGLTRDTASRRALAAAEIRPVVGDIADPDSYRQHLEEADAVVHTVLDMNDPAGTDQKLFAELRAAQDRTGRARHLIYTTGVSSYGRTGISLMDDDTPGNPDSPLHFRMRLEAELAACGLPHTVIRPGFIYGGEARTSMTSQWFADGEAGRAVFYGDRTKRWTWVHVDDLAAAYVAVLAHVEAADRQVFVVGDDHQPTALDVYTACLKAAGYTGEITFESAEAGGMLQVAADQDELVTSGKARRLLGWRPRRPGVLEDTATYHEAWRAAQSA